MSVPSDEDWPERLTEGGDKLFLKDKLLVPENRVEDLIDDWHNAELMHPGRDKMQKDLESMFLFSPGCYAILNRYCKACAGCRATKHRNRSTAGSPLYTAIPESPKRSISMDVFTMPKITVEGEVFDCVFWQSIATADTSWRFRAKNTRKKTRGTSTEWGCGPKPWRKQ